MNASIIVLISFVEPNFVPVIAGSVSGVVAAIIFIFVLIVYMRRKKMGYIVFSLFWFMYLYFMNFWNNMLQCFATSSFCLQTIQKERNCKWGMQWRIFISNGIGRCFKTQVFCLIFQKALTDCLIVNWNNVTLWYWTWDGF